MSLDKIKASVDTVMTPELVRLFKAAGCSPTCCHACLKTIRSGQTFKLLPHRKLGDRTTTDEMLCAKCGEPELVKRDLESARAAAKRRLFGGSSNGVRLGGGYSRPSIEQPQGSAAHSSGEGA